MSKIGAHVRRKNGNTDQNIPSLHNTSLASTLQLISEEFRATRVHISRLTSSDPRLMDLGSLLPIRDEVEPNRDSLRHPSGYVFKYTTKNSCSQKLMLVKKKIVQRCLQGLPPGKNNTTVWSLNFPVLNSWLETIRSYSILLEARETNLGRTVVYMYIPVIIRKAWKYDRLRLADEALSNYMYMQVKT